MQQQAKDLGIRPLGIGELADKSVTLVVKNAVPLALIWIVCSLPGILLSQWAATTYSSGALLFAKIVVGLGSSVAMMATAAFVGKIYDREPIKWLGALGRGAAKLPNAILLNIMLVLIAIIPLGMLALVTGGIFSSLASAPAAALAAAALPAIALLIAASLLYFMQYLALSDMAIAERAAPEALGKAFGYVFQEGRFKASLALSIILAIVIFGGSFAGGLVAGFVMKVVNYELGQAILAITTAIAGAVGAVVAAVFYLDLRMRYDGYDLEQSLDALEQPATT